MTNPYETRARTRKVRKLCKVLRTANEDLGLAMGPRPLTGPELAERVARWSYSNRCIAARAAGVRVPTPTTWNRVVRALRRYR